MVDGDDYDDDDDEGSGHDKDDNDGRHNDGKGQQGDGQHNDGDGRYDDAARRRRRATTVGTLQDGYVRNVPLPRVPREQRASPELTAPKAGIPLPGYSRLPAWIPTLPKIGNVFGFSQRLL